MAAPDLASFESVSSSPRDSGGDARTRVLFGSSDGLPWEYWLRQPSSELAGQVLELWAGSDPKLGARHRVLPNGELILMFHLDGAQEVVESSGAACAQPLGTSFVSGLQEQPIAFECSAPGTRVVSARIAPLGAWRLMAGLPQRELVSRVFDLESVIGSRSGTTELHEQMQNAPHLGRALDLLESWLVSRMRRAPDAPPVLAHALELLSRNPDTLVATHLARDCQLSPRRVREIFNDGIGIPAKRLARVLRFRRVLDRLCAEPEIDLAELALVHGYYDQPHLHREFRALSGMTPRAYLRAHGDGLDGPDVLGG